MTHSVYAVTSNSYGIPDIVDFIGYYYLNVEQLEDDYLNPSVLRLDFDEFGNFFRYDGLKYGTTGTTRYYYYNSYALNNNILTCHFDDVKGYEGESLGEPGGIHTFIMTEEGNIVEDGNVWYRVDETEGQQLWNTLVSVKEADFADGDFSEKKSFLGITELKRSDIDTITFTDSVLDAPENAWDVSVEQDRSVLAWVDPDKKGVNIILASEYGIYANPDCSYLFRNCINLKQIDFNDSFFTSSVSTMKYMFYGCKNLETVSGMEDWVLSNVYDMNSMFYDCKKLKYLDLDSWNMINVMDLQNMFYGCKNLKDLSLDTAGFGKNSNTTGMFDKTRWEGSSPILESGSITISTACILNTEYCMDDIKLRAAVINGYDTLLREKIEDKINFWGDWDSSFPYIFYSLKDINKDDIPELMIRSQIEDSYYFSFYYFDIPTCTVREMSGGGFSSKWPECYLAGDVLQYYRYTGEGAQVRIEDYGFIEEEYSEAQDGREGFNLIFPLPEEISHINEDLLGDGVERDVVIKASKDAAGYYRYMSIYIDRSGIYDAELYSSEIDTEWFFTTSGNEGEKDYVRNTFLYLRAGLKDQHDFCALLQYTGYSMEKRLDLDDLIEKDQLSESGSYFVPSIGEAVEMKFHLNTLALGSNLEFHITYNHMSDGTFVQTNYVSDIDNIWNAGQNATIYRKIIAYEDISGNHKAFELDKGEHVHFHKIWFSNGIIWIQLENENGRIGWIPVGNQKIFKEVGDSVSDKDKDSLLDLIALEPDKWNCYIPSDSELFDLGEEALLEKEDGIAYIYYALISETSSYYSKAKEKMEAMNSFMEKDGNSSYSEDENETVELKEESALSAYAEYLKELNDSDSQYESYIAIDLNADHISELLLICGQDYWKDCDVYCYNTTTGKVQFVGQTGDATYGIGYSARFGQLVMMSRSSSHQHYHFYEYDGNNINAAFTVGYYKIDEGKTGRRYDYFYAEGDGYFDDSNTIELGSYYRGDEEKRIEIEKRYNEEYLSYLKLVDTYPIWELDDRNGKELPYTCAVDNIARFDISDMLPVLWTHLIMQTDMVHNIEPGEKILDTSINPDNDFWKYLWMFAVLNSDKNSELDYTLDNVRRIAYALFMNYDGILPEISNDAANGVFIEDDRVQFGYWEPESGSLSLRDYKVNENDSVDASYLWTLEIGDEDVEIPVTAHYEINQNADYGSYYVLYYTLVSCEVYTPDYITEKSVSINTGGSESYSDDEEESEFQLAIDPIAG